MEMIDPRTQGPSERPGRRATVEERREHRKAGAEERQKATVGAPIGETGGARVRPVDRERREGREQHVAGVVAPALGAVRVTAHRITET